MDVVLELTDTFIADYVYAFAHPARAAPFDYQPGANASEQTFSAWQFKPATHLFHVAPSQYAFMSAWDRDNICRQAITLFMITW